MKQLSNRVANQSAIKLALLAKQAHAQVEDILAAEPIAVIGMSCRFPGGGENPDAFWQALLAKTDAAVEVPADRFDVDAFYDPDLATPGKMNFRKAGLLPKIDEFDANYFGIHPREATTMDPQQRLILEVACEALEDAALPQEKLSGTQTGVFIASYHSDYNRMQYADLESIDVRTLTGALHAVVPNRVSFLLNLHGPSLAVDTACSSSLVAVHLACQSLRSRESEIALAGGVSLIISPDMNIALSKVGFISPDGSCRTFDSRADGFARGEGCGVIVLKRLADALADNDRVLAVIRGSAVNQDGRSSILTAPNGLAQQAVIKQALINAGVSPDQVGLIEAHGTGTLLGDPIEVEALREVIGPKRSENHVCYLTSVKPNLGHLEAAAGMAGIIKAVLCLKNQAIPAHIKFSELNPHISLQGTPFVIPTENIPWDKGEGACYAGVSSFGVGGTNAHVVLGEAPTISIQPQPNAVMAQPQAYILPFSAKSPKALSALAELYEVLLENSPEKLEDICYTASVRRTHYELRGAVVGSTKEEMSQKLHSLLDRLDETESDLPGKVAFVFSGQGPQWWGMGRELLKNEILFKQRIEEIDNLLQPLAGWSLLKEFEADETDSRFNETAFAQPAIFALQVGLDSLWREWGIIPDAVVGHSVGEIAAAVSAGAIGLEEAVKLVYNRGRLMQEATGNGKMASVSLPEAEIREILFPTDKDGRFGNRLSIAAVNSPGVTVLSGEGDALDDMCSELSQHGVEVRPLHVNYAFHSAQMKPFAEELEGILMGLTPRRAVIPMISTVTGEILSGLELDASYWKRNMLQPVRFAAATEKLGREGYTIFVELSPHPVLSPMVGQTLEAYHLSGISVPSMRRQQPEKAALLSALGELYRAGRTIHWDKQFPQGGRVVSLPTYPWKRQRYWFEPKVHQGTGKIKTDSGVHPLLQNKVSSPAFNGVLYQTEVSPSSPGYLSHHRILDEVVFPAAASMEMVLSASQRIFGSGIVSLEDMSFMRAVILPEGADTTLQLHLTPEVEESVEITLFQRKLESDYGARAREEDWLTNVTGKARLVREVSPTQTNLQEVKKRCTQEVSPQDYYDQMAADGTVFGESFQSIKSLRIGEGEVLAEVYLPEVLHSEAEAYLIHPALLDGVMQPIGLLLPAEWKKTGSFIPIGIGQMTFHRKAGNLVWSHVRVSAVGATEETLTGDVTVFDENGKLVLEINNLSLQRVRTLVSKQKTARYNDASQWLLEVQWEEQSGRLRERIEATGLKDKVLIFCDEVGIGSALAVRLMKQGFNCQEVKVGNTFELESGKWWINPAQPEHFKRLLEEIEKQNETDRLRIIHLWSLDGNSDIFPEGNPLMSILHLTQALALRNPPELDGMWLVTAGAQPVSGTLNAAQQAGVWGLGRTIALENPSLQCRMVDLDPMALVDKSADVLETELLGKDNEEGVAYRNGSRYAARLGRISQVTTLYPPKRLAISKRGLLSGVELISQTRQSPGSGEIEIRVVASGLNFRDVLKVLDRYPADPDNPREIDLLGDECAGEVVSVGEGVTEFQVGERVVALASGCHASYVTVDARLAVPLQAELSFDEAASIPIAYLTAWYAMYTVGKLREGERVLIHAAAGGVGLAAVYLAHRCGAEVYATAGSLEKREFLKALGVKHVFDSRSLSFADEVLSLTNGEGVDMALNSLAGDFIPATIQAIHANGRFLEIGKTGIWTEEQVHAIKPHASYHVIYLGDLFKNEPESTGILLREIMSMVAAGSDQGIKPLLFHRFPISAADRAFRFMAQAKHIGKIVLTQPAQSVPFSAGNLVENKSTAAFRDDASYLLTGGMGGIGKHLARWMAKNGAKNIVIPVFGEINTPETKALLVDLENFGAKAAFIASDLSQPAEVERLLNDVENNFPPLRGVFHLAGLIDDGILTQQNWSRFDKVLANKVRIAINLYNHSRHLTSGALDFFVMFSSVAGIFGSAGQSNYAAANTMLDALAYEWFDEGVNVQSLSWGLWDAIGMAATIPEHDRQRYQQQGWGLITPEAGMQVLGMAMREKLAHMVIFPADWREFLQHTGEKPFFNLMKNEWRTKKQPAVPRVIEKLDFVKRWNETLPALRRGFLMNFLIEEAAQVIGLPAVTKVDSRTALRDVGMDSLMAVELRNVLTRKFGTSLPATMLFDYPTCETLADFLMKTVPALRTFDQPTEERQMLKTDLEVAGAGKASPVENMSDEEAEAMLLAELDALKKKK